MKRKIFLWIVTACFLQSPARAQFTTSAEIRPRAEYRDGFKKPLSGNDEAAFFIEQRTRLSTAFSSEQFDILITLQDVRIWGATAQIYKTDPTLHNIYTASASYKFSPKHVLSVGRMELDYDNARILGNLDWAAQGRSHDLIKYAFKSKSIEWHVGAAFNQDYNTPEPAKLSDTYYAIPGNYKTMQYTWAHKKWKVTDLSILFLNNGVATTKTVNAITYADSSVNFSQTVGLYGNTKIGDASIEFDGYYQTGRNGAGSKVRAYLVGLNTTFFRSAPNTLTVGFDYVSGDKTSASKVEAFDVLYGTHHKFYGWMDYFYVGNPHMNKGLINPFLKGKFKTAARSSLLLHVHQFFTDSRIILSDNQEMSRNLGTEIDAVLVANLAPYVDFHLGYSHMFYTESMEVVKGVINPKGSGLWAWAQISFKPVLFTTKSAETK